MPGSAGNPPIVSGQNILIQRGYTVLTFGTEWVGNNMATHGSYIVTDVRAAQRAETVPALQGSGATAVITQVVDGQDFNITVIDDGSVIPPYVGQIVQLQNVFYQQIGNTVAPFGNTLALTGNFVVENNDFHSSRKNYGERTILAKAYQLITGIQGANNPNGLGT